MIAWLLVGLLFAAACLASALWLVEREKLASYKRVGTWFEKRVEELENENRQLAEQIVIATGQPSRQAMPLPPAEYAYEYHSDPTGLVTSRVDPNDYS